MREVFYDLHPNTDYEIQVRAVGNGGKYSKWSKVYKLATIDARNTMVVLLEKGQTVQNYIDTVNKGVNLPVGAIILEKVD